ncbi:MAG: Abi family protein [Nitrosospira sp.]
MQYNKPPLRVMDQIALLKQRGMIFPDVGDAQQALAHINYYRLRPYWLPFEDFTRSAKDQDGQHLFQTNTSFGTVLVYYAFDQRLKLLLMDAIERVEVSLRTHWAHELALRYGSHAYLKDKLFSNIERHSRCLAWLQDEVSRSHETFIRHYLDTYSHPKLPPIWAVCEVMSLGQLSQWLSNLKHRIDRQAIVHSLGFDERIICTFAHHLATVRNLCAHHSRVWNRKFTVRMKLPQQGVASANYFNSEESQKVYNTLLMLTLLLNQISPGSTWKARVLKLIATMPAGTTAAMGYPEDWMNMSVWDNRELEA